MSARAWLRPAAGVLVVVVLVVHFGADPVVRGLRTADGPLLAVAVVLTVAATACCAWRWRIVAAALDVEVGFRAAYVSCYRAQFLNATLPAGVLGDVHRAVEHGRRAASAGRAARSVVWERGLGLAVQVLVTVAVVVLVPTGLRPAGLAVGVAGALALGIAVVALPRVRTLRADAVAVLGSPRAAVAVVTASLGVAGCHAVVLLAAMRSAGVGPTGPQTLALALAVLLGSAVPTSIAGWGPREGAAAWAFAAVGLPASQGLEVSVAYGVAALVATLPGAVALLATRRTGAATGSPGTATAVPVCEEASVG